MVGYYFLKDIKYIGNYRLVLLNFGKTQAIPEDDSRGILTSIRDQVYGRRGLIKRTAGQEAPLTINRPIPIGHPRREFLQATLSVLVFVPLAGGFNYMVRTRRRSKQRKA